MPPSSLVPIITTPPPPIRARYDLAEKEFVAAKLELHKTKEEKELLSEHLCAIIHQTELRKAKKLAQLCQALGVNDMSEEVESLS